MQQTARKMTTDMKIIADEFHLTFRELDVLACLLCGNSSKKIAVILGITARTVDLHVYNMTQKTGVNSRVGLVGLIEKNNCQSNIRTHYDQLLRAYEFKEAILKNTRYIRSQKLACKVVCQNNVIKQRIVMDLKKIGVVHKIKAQKIVIIIKSDDNKKPKQDFDFVYEDNYELLFFNILYRLHPNEGLKSLCEHFAQDVPQNVHVIGFQEGPLPHNLDFITYIEGEPYPIGRLVVAIFIIIALLFFIISKRMVVKNELFLSKQQLARSKVPSVWRMPNPNPYFVGRQFYFQQIEDFFKCEHYLCVIAGSPGYGKTQIAKRYAHQHYSEFDCVWWFDCSLSLEEQYADFAEEILLNYGEANTAKKVSTMAIKKIITEVSKIIRTKGLRVLLIFDNASGREILDQYVPFSHQGNVKVLMTTRNLNWGKNATPVRPFSKDEAVDFIRKTVLNKKIDETQRTLLIESLKGYPLGLALTVKYLESKSKAELDMLLKKNKQTKTIALFSHNVREPSSLEVTDTYKHTVYEMVRLMLKKYEADPHKILSALGFISVFPTMPLPLKYLERWAVKNRLPLSVYDIIEHINKNALIDLGDPKKQSDGKYEMVYIHDVIKESISDQMPSSDRKNRIQEAVNIFLEEYSGRSDEIVLKINTQKSDAQLMCDLVKSADEINFSSPELLSLKIKLMDILVGGIRDFERANEIIHSVENDLTLKHIKFLNRKDELLYLTNLGLFNGIVGSNLKSSISLMLKAYGLEKKHNISFEERIRIMANIIQCYWRVGAFKNAEPFIQAGQDVLKESQSAPYNTLFLSACAMILLDKGDFEDILVLTDIYKDQISACQGYVTIQQYILFYKLEALIRLKKITEAEQLAKKIRAEALAYYGTDQETFFARLTLLEVLLAVSTVDHVNAVSLKERVNSSFSIFDTVYGKDVPHRNRAFGYFVLGRIYEFEKNYTKALEIYRQSDQLYRAFLQNNTRIDHVSVLFEHIVKMAVMIKNLPLARQYLDEHVKLFGAEHPRTRTLAKYVSDEDVE